VHLRTGNVTHTFTPRDARLYFSRPVAEKQPRYEPVDYKIWAVMQERGYQKRVNDVDELCQRLLIMWHSTGQNVIDEAIDQWRARLTACVRAKVGHFEHLV